MVDTSTLHLVDAMASSTKHNVYVCTYGYFTLQRSQLQHTGDISISAEQSLARNEMYVCRVRRGSLWQFVSLR